MKLKLGTSKLTFMVIREANASVVRFRMRSIFLYLVPTIIILSAVAIYILSKLYMNSVSISEQLEAQLQAENIEHGTIVDTKDRTIEQLMADVVELSSQTELVQEKLDELQQLSDQIKSINGEPEASVQSNILLSQADKQDVMIASASATRSSAYGEDYMLSMSQEVAMKDSDSTIIAASIIANDYIALANLPRTANGLTAAWDVPDQISDTDLAMVFDGLLIDKAYTLDMVNGKGGSLHEVTAEEILVLASSMKHSLQSLETRMGDLKIDLEEAKEIAIEYQHMLRITPSISPTTSTRITSTFGYRKDPFTRRLSHHSGIDFGGRTGDPIYATAEGKVVGSSYDRYLGHHVIIDHTNGIRTVYAHLSKRLVSVGDEVLKGDQIGKLGSTGRSTGPHLHYEVYKHGVAVNPKTYLP